MHLRAMLLLILSLACTSAADPANVLNGHLSLVKGEALEQAVDAYLQSSEGGGWQALRGEMGRNGFDHLYVQRTPGAGITSVLLADSKYSTSGLAIDTHGDQQLSKNWVARKLAWLASGTANPLAKQDYQRIATLAETDACRRRVFMGAFADSHLVLRSHEVQLTGADRCLVAPQGRLIGSIPVIGTAPANALHLESFRTTWLKAYATLAPAVHAEIQRGFITDDTSLRDAIARSARAGLPSATTAASATAVAATSASTTTKVSHASSAKAASIQSTKGTLAAWWHYLVHGIAVGTAKLAGGVAVIGAGILVKVKAFLIPAMSVILAVVAVGVVLVVLGWWLFSSGWLTYSAEWAVAFGA